MFWTCLANPLLTITHTGCPMHANFRTTYRKLIFSVAMLVALVAVQGGTARAEVELRWKFKSGETIRFSTIMDMQQDMEIGGQQLNSKMSQIMDMTWVVKEAGAEQALVEVTIDHVHVEMTPPGPAAKAIVYDSQNENHEGAAAMMAPLFGSMVNQPMALTVTPLGEVKDIKLPAGMLEAMKKAGPGAAEVLSEDAMKQTLGRVVIKFPESVAPGASWDVDFVTKNPVLGKQSAVTTYTYVGPDKAENRAVEKLDVKVQLSFEQAPEAQAKATIKEQASEGEILFDNKQGMPLTTTMNSQMKIELAAGGQMIDQNITTKVSMKQIPPAAK